ncbi:hypothetical protein, partial [Treponema sp. R6D11]
MYVRAQGGIGSNQSPNIFFIKGDRLCVDDFQKTAYIYEPSHIFDWICRRSGSHKNNFKDIQDKNIRLVRMVIPTWLNLLFKRNYIDNNDKFQNDKVKLADRNKGGISYGLKGTYLRLFCETTLYTDQTFLDSSETITRLVNSYAEADRFPQREYNKQIVADLLKKLNLSNDDISLVSEYDQELIDILQKPPAVRSVL